MKYKMHEDYLLLVIIILSYLCSYLPLAMEDTGSWAMATVTTSLCPELSLTCVGQK